MSPADPVPAQSADEDSVQVAHEFAVEAAAARHGLLAGAGLEGGQLAEVGGDERVAALDAIAWNLPRPEPERLPPDDAWPADGAAA